MEQQKTFKLTLPVAIIILSISILISGYMIMLGISDAASQNNNDDVYINEISRFNDNFDQILDILQKNRKN